MERHFSFYILLVWEHLGEGGNDKRVTIWRASVAGYE